MLFATTALALKPAITDAEAQEAHANGSCGSVGPGTGLPPDGRGYILSMLPGRHEFRMVGGGTVGVTAARHQAYDFDAGRGYWIEVTGPVSHLQWRMLDRDWGPVPRAFLYPPENR